MNTGSNLRDERGAYELWFQSLSDAGRALAFPCNVDGKVDFDALSTRSRNNYLFARAVVGRDYSVPVVRRRDLH